MNYDDAPVLSRFERAHWSGEPRVFEVRVEPEATLGPRQWSYMVRPVAPPDSSGELYFAGVFEVRPGLVQLEATQNSLPDEYRHCCITCGLVPVIARHLQSSVRSSRNPAPSYVRVGPHSVAIETRDEMRSEAAEKVWTRMVGEGIARYDPVEDRYYHDFDSDA
jgi:hypothetical protein